MPIGEKGGKSLPLKLSSIKLICFLSPRRTVKICAATGFNQEDDIKRIVTKLDDNKRKQS
jgi:hypothetical protein